MKDDLYIELEKLGGTHWWLVDKQQIVKSVMGSNLGKESLVVDVGCGAGVVLDTLRSKGGFVVGVDNSLFAQKICLDKGIDFRMGTAEALPLASESAKIVLMNDVLEHLERPDLAMDEAYRVLKFGGKLVVSVPALQLLWSGWDVSLGHKRRYNATDLKQCVRGAGFEVERVWYEYWYLVLPIYVFRKLKSILTARSEYVSDFSEFDNPWINKLLLNFSKFVRGLIVNLPFGTSVWCVAWKR